MTCKDCIKFNTCKLKDENFSIGIKVKELDADRFKCFVERKSYEN